MEVLLKDISTRESFGNGAPAEASAGRGHARTYRAPHLATRRMGGPPTCVFFLLFLFSGRSSPPLLSLPPSQALLPWSTAPPGGLPGRRRHRNRPIRPPSARSAFDSRHRSSASELQPSMMETTPLGAILLEPTYVEVTFMVIFCYNRRASVLQPASFFATNSHGETTYDDFFVTTVVDFATTGDFFCYIHSNGVDSRPASTYFPAASINGEGGGATTVVVKSCNRRWSCCMGRGDNEPGGWRAGDEDGQ